MISTYEKASAFCDTRKKLGQVVLRRQKIIKKIDAILKRTSK